MPDAKKKEESPLSNIIVNVLLPVVVLSQMSKDPMEVGAMPWHVGPMKALIIALIIPLGYGIYHFAKTRKFNLFSAIGLFSVLLTGGVTLYLWNEDGTVKPDAAFWFGLKEAVQPLILGGVVLGSHYTKGPLFREFIYTPAIFDIKRIEAQVKELGKEEAYQKMLFQNTLFFCCSFIISAILNIGLAYFFLGNLDFTAENARELYNQGTAKIMGWGFVVILVPMMVILVSIVLKQAKDIGKLTELEREDYFLLGS